MNNIYFTSQCVRYARRKFTEVTTASLNIDNVQCACGIQTAIIPRK